jgi:hypothetical protein
VPARLLDVDVAVRERVGVDLDPVDVRDDERALLLRAFVWADRHERLAQLDRAIEAVRREPPRLLRGDYVDLLPGLLAARLDGALTVCFQTASMVYLTPEGREAVYAALEEAGRDGPLAWIASAFDEDVPDGFPLEVRMWPGGQRRVALMDFHGAWLDWLA